MRAAVYVAVFLVMAPIAHAATNKFAVVNNSVSAYLINGDSNPDLRLVRGYDYTFTLNASGHPFWIKTVQGTGTGNSYNDGVTGNGTAVGSILFSVPTNAPSPLFYNCQFHAPMTGMLLIEDAPAVHITDISVDTTNLVLHSTGTDALNVMIESRSNLVDGTWSPTAIVTNQYAAGTNTTQIAAPSAPNIFIRLLQGFP